ncbi:TPA: GNAT family N-acetyltransferase [Aeromonas dhakensis]|uniref:GNAT family N-acetyltransferase n=1 Tax=Aeromonas dhakensis TaxID=196024 RepID=UPI000E3C5ABA|nr:GNAT family N-acetyltransferase [Aeromonas dhakensis]RFS25700.1 GNAT family N-acetyltransferase [Aeromonas dhakensis]HDX8345304.1 GNAT family N-acetyltransferase [Aeromonas dhakensis]HDX8376202.1 GNAT family N-acetyltransferase [Aeromonas dhakensis]
MRPSHRQDTSSSGHRGKEHSLEIRKAREQDIEAILELNRQIGEIHFAQAPQVFCPPSPEERAFLLAAIVAEGRLFCVAEQEGAVAGFLTARIDINETIPFLSKEPICRIGTLVVDEGQRSRGIGKALIAHCDEWGKAQGASQLRLEVMAFNERAKALYERLGFKMLSQTMAR